MADVMFGETSKKVLFLLEKLARKHLKATAPVVEQDMENCGNPVYKAVYQTLVAGGNNIKTRYHKRVVKELGGLALWILYKDTAYRDVTMWILYNLLSRADILLPEVEKYLKDPEDWYPNVWIESKQKTKQMRKDGKIPEYANSHVEEIYTPSIQKKRLEKLNK